MFYIYSSHMPFKISKISIECIHMKPLFNTCNKSAADNFQEFLSKIYGKYTKVLLLHWDENIVANEEIAHYEQTFTFATMF